MIINEKIRKIEELRGNEELIFNKEYQNFLKNLKDEISTYEGLKEDYSKKNIESFEEYKKVKEELGSIDEINNLLEYIGKGKVDISNNANTILEKNKKFRIKEKLDKFNINNDGLVGNIEKLISNYNGKITPFMENNYLCLLFDNRVDVNSARSILKDYTPLIFPNNKYTKIILKEV